MAQPRPSRIPQPSTKLGPENVGSHQVSSHRHAVANARKAQEKGKLSEKSLEGTSHDVIAPKNLDTPVSGDASDPETSDATIPNPKKRPIVLSDDNDSEDLSSTPAQQSDSPRPKKKKKAKKRTSTGK